MQHAASSGFFELTRLERRPNGGKKVVTIRLGQAEPV